MGEWYIRVIEKRRKNVDIDLLAQIAVALARQLAEDEANQRTPAASSEGDAKCS